MTKMVMICRCAIALLMTSSMTSGTVLRGVPDEQRLMAKIYRNYDPNVRPVYNASNSVLVKFGASLIQIIDLAEESQVLTTNMWLEHEWIDMRLTWEPAEYNQLSVLRLPASKIWLPDIVLYNNADDYTGGYMVSNAMIHSDGRVFWSPPVRLRSSCKVDITYFPFDEQTCVLKFGSWTYDQAQVNVTHSRIYVDQTNYVTNGEWSLITTRVDRHAVTYAIGSAVYPDVTVTLRLGRRVVHYLLYIIIPCVWLNIISLLVFRIPPDAGEKVTLGITVVLSYSVFTLLVAETMPQSSEFVPLIGLYLTISMAVTSLSIVVSVFVLNLYHCRQRHQSELSPWIRRFVLGRLARFLRCRTSISCRMQHQPSTTRRHRHHHRNQVSKSTGNNQPFSSDSMLRFKPEVNVVASRGGLVLDSMMFVAEETEEISLKSIDRSRLGVIEKHFDLPEYIPMPNNLNSDVIAHQNDGDVTGGGRAENHDVRVVNAVEEIVGHLRSLVDRRDREDIQADVVSEWHQVALVVDQFLFLVFLIITVVYTTVFLVIIPLTRNC